MFAKNFLRSLPLGVTRITEITRIAELAEAAEAAEAAEVRERINVIWKKEDPFSLHALPNTARPYG